MPTSPGSRGPGAPTLAGHASAGLRRREPPAPAGRAVRRGRRRGAVRADQLPARRRATARPHRRATRSARAHRRRDGAAPGRHRRGRNRRADVRRLAGGVADRCSSHRNPGSTTTRSRWCSTRAAPRRRRRRPCCATATSWRTCSARSSSPAPAPTRRCSSPCRRTTSPASPTCCPTCSPVGGSCSCAASTRRSGSTRCDPSR